MRCDAESESQSLDRIRNLRAAIRDLHVVELEQAVILVLVSCAGSLQVAMVSTSELERQ